MKPTKKVISGSVSASLFKRLISLSTGFAPANKTGKWNYKSGIIPVSQLDNAIKVLNELKQQIASSKKEVSK